MYVLYFTILASLPYIEFNKDGCVHHLRQTGFQQSFQKKKKYSNIVALSLLPRHRHAVALVPIVKACAGAFLEAVGVAANRHHAAPVVLDVDLTQLLHPSVVVTGFRYISIDSSRPAGSQSRYCTSHGAFLSPLPISSN